MPQRSVPFRDRRSNPGLPLALWAAVGGLMTVQGVQAYQAAGGAAPASGERAKVAVSPHDTVDIHVKDENIVNVLELLGVGTQRNIIASKNVSVKVSADLYNVTFEEALNALLRSNGLDYVQEGSFIYVYTAEEMAELKKRLVKRQGKVLTMSYLSAADAAEFVKPLLSEGGEIKFVGKSPDFNIPSNSPTGADTYALGATMVVIDFPENISAIEQVLTELDTKPKQVLVQATVLQTQLSEQNAFGVDFAIIADANFTDFLKIGGPLNVANALVSGGDGQDAKGGLSPTGNNAVGIGSTPGATAGPSTLKIGVIGGNVSAFVKLLDQVSDTVVLSNPRLLTLNRQPARVLVGERVAYLSTTQTETSQTQTVQYLDTGVQLYVRPFVAPNNQIRMELKPQVSNANIRNIQSGSGEVTVPDEITQEIVTNVIVNDGMTVVLGGLFQERTTANRKQVPVLGDIPIIGAAFRGFDDDTRRNELIFLVTPTVMNDSSLLVAGYEAGQTIDRIRAGTRQGILPWSRDRMTSVLNVEAEKLARDGQADEALWKLQRSLSLNPRQPEALQLRERLTGERELWPDRTLIDDLVDGEVRRRIDSIPVPPQPQEHHRPWGSTEEIPRVPVTPMPTMPHSDATPIAAPRGPVIVHAEPKFDPAALASTFAPRQGRIEPAGSAVPVAAPAGNDAQGQLAAAPPAQAEATASNGMTSRWAGTEWTVPVSTSFLGYALGTGWSLPVCVALPVNAYPETANRAYVAVPTDGDR